VTDEIVNWRAIVCDLAVLGDSAPVPDEVDTQEMWVRLVAVSKLVVDIDQRLEQHNM